MDILSLSIGFLGGALTGAASVYFGNMYTDRRRSQEEAKEIKELFRHAADQMPELIAEMKVDLTNPEFELVREFFVQHKGNKLGTRGKFFSYFYEEHADLLSKVHVLENLGYVMDVATGSVPKYRMNEQFVELIRAS